MKKKVGNPFLVRRVILLTTVLMLLSFCQIGFAERESAGLMVVEHKVKTGNSERVARGYIDSSGSLKFGGFQKAEDFSEGLAWVLPDEKDNYNNYGVIDTSGKLVIAPQNFSNFKAFSCGLARVELRSENGYHFIDRSGKLVLKGYSSAESFSFDRALVKKDNQKFFIDKSGNRLFQEKNYYYLESYSDGLALVQMKDDKGFDSSLPPYGFIDTNGEVAIDMRKSGIKNYGMPQRFSEGLAAVKYLIKDYDYGILFINKSGKVAFDIGDRFSEAYPFSDGMAMVKERSSEKWGYVNTSGQIALPPVYSKNIDFFHEGRALVSMPETPTRFGYIDKTGKFIYGPEAGSYSSLGNKEWLFHESTCRFKGGMASYIGKVINLNGQIIWPNDKATTAVVSPGKAPAQTNTPTPNSSGNAKVPQPNQPDQPVPTAPQPLQKSDYRDLNGTWEQSGYGPITFEHGPISGQSSIPISGKWVQGAGMIGSFNGTYNVSKGEVSVSYTMSWQSPTGTAQWKLSPDGKKLTGKYFQDGGEGGWNASRSSIAGIQPATPAESISSSSTSQSQTQQSSQSNFYSIAGEWKSNWGSIVFNHELNPTNNELLSLTGDWYMGAGRSPFSGTYNLKTLEANFTYEMPWYGTKGTAQLKFDPRANSFSGKYFETSSSGDMKGTR